MTRRRFFRIVAWALLAGCILLLCSILPSAVCIRSARYTVTLDGLDGTVRIVMLSDLHGREFGENNSRLLSKIAAEAPDAIFLVGDLLDSEADAQDAARLYALVRELAAIAPVFFAPGNHELNYMERDADLLAQVAEAGATVVNDSYVDVTLAGQTLRIGGTMGHGFAFGRTWAEFTGSEEYQFLTAFQQTELPKLCLAHMPDTFIFNGAYLLWDVDLVLSGHTHGGLVRLPLVGGVYAPMQGFFPKYDRGLFRLGEHMQMLITSGLAGHDWLPRVNNLPELVTVELAPGTNGQGELWQTTMHS